MGATRYRESRILVRGLCRLPGEERTGYRSKVACLRKHFERFNTDTAELCQWWFALRKQTGAGVSPASFGLLGDFLLEPTLEGVDADEPERDRWRLAVFDAVAGIRPANSLKGNPVPQPLLDAIKAADDLPRSKSAKRLFTRLKDFEPAHRLVLLKSAAEWIIARYQRGVENWVRQHAEWEREKLEWEKAHPQLTPTLQQKFTGIFRQLKNDEKKGGTGVTRKQPRICPHERLKQNLNNCCYAGEKGHGPLCSTYAEFVKKQKAATKDRFNDRKFFEYASRFIEFCRTKNVRRPQYALQSPNLPAHLFKDCDDRKRTDLFRLFKANWTAYLKEMNLTSETVLQRGRLPHCAKIGGEIFEKSKCEHNPHTELCLEYKRLLAAACERGDLTEADLALESKYREWRKDFLAGPRKPTFAYPSARELPMPKIFGEGFHELDLDRSILRVRLDKMPKKEEWIEFGFRPWPRRYRPSREEVKGRITSIHINFVGTRPRAGFRFSVTHADSRFACPQDEIDRLRSREFPRRAQDQQFLEAARKALLDTLKPALPPRAGEAPGTSRAEGAGRFTPSASFRVLAVDLGEKGVAAAVYEGKKHVRDISLRVIKINKRYAAPPEKLDKDPKGPRDSRIDFNEKEDPRGLRKEHVARHLAGLAEGAKALAEYRKEALEVDAPVTLADHDFRALKRHTAWMIRDWVRLNTKQIIDAAEENLCDLIVFESMRGSKPPGYDQLGEENERKKRSMAMFAYGRIRRKVVEKAVERGMRVVTVPYFKSSQVCSACGHEQMNKPLWSRNKKERKFNCQCGEGKSHDRKSPPPDPKCRCRAELNSDANAARVLARVFWGEIRLPKWKPGS